MQQLMMMKNSIVCCIKSKNLSALGFSDLMARLDNAYLLSSRSVISTRDKKHILFDTKLQHQLGVMMHIHEHSYDHLRRVFGETSGDGHHDEDVFETGN